MHGHKGTPSKASIKAEKATKLCRSVEPSNVKASDGTVYAIQATGAFKVCDRRGQPARRLTNREKKAYKRGRVKALKERDNASTSV